MPTQLKLNLSRTIQADDGNTLVSKTFRGPAFIIELVSLIAKRTGKDSSKLIAEYVIEGVMRDVGVAALTDIHSSESLKNILAGH